jgi:hypothetical protein
MKGKSQNCDEDVTLSKEMGVKTERIRISDVREYRSLGSSICAGS